MSYIIYFVFLCFISFGMAIDHQAIVDAVRQRNKTTESPLKFPNKSPDSSRPIIIGENPKSSKLPPRIFPTQSPDQNSTGPSIISRIDLNITGIKKNNPTLKLDSPVNKIPESNNSTPGNTTETDTTMVNPKLENPTAEQEDMLHSQYKGGQDVDEILKSKKKADEEIEKKQTISKKDPKSEVTVTPMFDKKGPKLMNESRPKSGESMIESTSKMMVVSSSVLANTQAKEHGIIEPLKTVATVLLSVIAMACLGGIGFLVWKKIAMRRSGRDVLINEDDFDEVADMHTFDRAQIQIT